MMVNKATDSYQYNIDYVACLLKILHFQLPNQVTLPLETTQWRNIPRK